MAISLHTCLLMCKVVAQVRVVLLNDEVLLSSRSWCKQEPWWRVPGERAIKYFNSKVASAHLRVVALAWGCQNILAIMHASLWQEKSDGSHSSSDPLPIRSNFPQRLGMGQNKIPIMKGHLQLPHSSLMLYFLSILFQIICLACSSS